MNSARPKRRTTVAFGILCVLMIVAAWHCYQDDLFSAARQYDSEVQAAQKEGLLVNLSDYRPKPVPEAQNAGQLYTRAIVAIDSYKPAFKELGKAPRKDAALRKLEPLLAKFRAASKRPRLDFDRDWRQSLSLDYPQYGAFRLISSTLAISATNRAEKGDLAGAIDDARTIARMSSHLGQEPVILAAIVRALMTDDAFRVLSQIIEKHGQEPKVREDVRQAVNDMGPSPDFRFVTQLELPTQLAAIDTLSKDTKTIEQQSGSAPSAASLGRYEFARKAFKTRSIQYWRSIYAQLPKDPTDYFTIYNAMRDLDEERTGEISHGHDEHHGDHKEPLKSLSYAMLNYMRPNFYGGSISMARAETKKRLLIGACDLLDGKSALPTDPFSGKTLVHRGNLLYSVGENQRDDNGWTKPSALDGQPMDFAIKLPR